MPKLVLQLASEITQSFLGSQCSKENPIFSFIDPRSPSVGIMRTPISLEKVVDHVIDPRSPTCGIDRTPIYSKPSGMALHKQQNPALIIS